jgi:hypothetical protein
LRRPRKGRRDDFVEPYFKGAGPDAIVVILKAREPARIMTAIGDSKANRWHLQIANRWVVQYNFYINDRQWGRMFVRICPYLPFSARVCLNQHHWLANRMREEGIAFRQRANAFMRWAAPERLQQLADSLTPGDLLSCGQKWLTRLTPFFTSREREVSGCQHRLFFSQVEFCDNLIFQRRAALDKLGERLLRCQSHDRAAQQDHRDLRAQDQQALSRQAANRDRRHGRPGLAVDRLPGDGTECFRRCKQEDQRLALNCSHDASVQSQTALETGHQLREWGLDLG